MTDKELQLKACAMRRAILWFWLGDNIH